MDELKKLVESLIGKAEKADKADDFGDVEHEVAARVEYEGRIVKAKKNKEGRKWDIIPPEKASQP